MINLIKLELRKSRMVFVGLAAGFVISLASSLVWPNIPLASGLEAVLVQWMYFGFSVAGLLFGCSAGAALRQRETAAAESILPFSPGKRILASLSANALWTIPFLLVSLLGQHAHQSVFCGLYLFLSGFTCSYLFGNGVAGGCAAVITLVPLWDMLFRTNLYPWLYTRTYTLYSLVKLPTVLAAFGGMAGVLWLACNRLEKKRSFGIWGMTLVIAGLLAGDVTAIGSFLYAVRKTAVETWICPVRMSEGADKWEGHLPTITLSGEIGLIDQNGKRTVLLPGWYRPPFAYFRSPKYRFPSEVVSMVIDKDSGLWVLFHNNTLYRAKTPDSKLEPQSEITAQIPQGLDYVLAWKFDTLSLRSIYWNRAECRCSYAAIPPADGKKLVWTKHTGDVCIGDSSSPRREYKKSEAYRNSLNTAGKTGWKKQGRPQFKYFPLAGGAWYDMSQNELFVISPKGEYMPPFDLAILTKQTGNMQGLESALSSLCQSDEAKRLGITADEILWLARPLRWNNGHLWVISGGWLFELDMAGSRVVWGGPLPKWRPSLEFARRPPLQITSEGFFWEADNGQVYFVKWDSDSSQLGPRWTGGIWSMHRYKHLGSLVGRQLLNVL